jgi:ankyrin repeat protein
MNASACFTALYADDLATLCALLGDASPDTVWKKDPGQGHISLLHGAARADSLVLVDWLLAQGANPSLPDSTGLPPLWHALTRWGGPGIAVADRLLQAGASIHTVTWHGQPLHWAAEAGHLPLLQRCLDAGVAPDARRNKDNATAFALGASHPQVVQVLLAHGAAPNPGLVPSPLATALLKGNEETIQALRDVGCHLQPEDAGYLLFKLAKDGGSAAVLRAVEWGATNLDSIDHNGVPVVHLTSSNVDGEALRILVEAGADINVVDDRGDTVRDHFQHEWEGYDPSEDADDMDDEEIEHAKMHGRRIDAFGALLETLGAEPGPGQQRDQPGDLLDQQFADVSVDQLAKAVANVPPSIDLLRYAVHRGAVALVRQLSAVVPVSELAGTDLSEVARLGPTAMLEALLDLGRSPHAPDEHGLTPVHEAASFHLHGGAADRIRLLLSRSVDVDDRSHGVDHDDRYARGWTPLMRALAAGTVREVGPGDYWGDASNPSVVDALLVHGADPAAVADSGYSVLHAACVAGRLDIVEQAQAAGCDVKAITQYGRTPLHEAARRGQLHLVDWLLGRQVAVDIQDVEGSTPLHLAISGQHVEVVRRLLPLTPHLRDVGGRTPLLLAAECGLNLLFPDILEAGADVRDRDHQRRGVLHFVATNSAHRHIGTMLSFMEPAAVADNEQKMLQASLAGVRLLIDQGAEPGATDFDGQTALHVAASQSMLARALGETSDFGAELCRCLVDAGTDPEAPDGRGQTAEQLARSVPIREYLAGL